MTGVAPVLVGVVISVVLGAVALQVGAINLRDGETSRLTARRGLVTAFARNLDVDLTLARMGDVANGVALGDHDPVVLERSLEMFRQRYRGHQVASAVFVGLDGSVRAASPRGTTLVPEALGPHWIAALNGQPARSPAFSLDGAVVTAAVLPIGRPIRSGVLVAIQRALESPQQQYYAGIGAQNGQPGGLVYVDGNGVALQAYDPEKVGQRVVPPDRVRSLPDDAQVWTDWRDGREVTFVGSRAGGGFALIFEQETDLLFGDLRAAQAGRNVTTLLVLAGALAALIAFQVARERAARRGESRIRSLMVSSQDLILVAEGSGQLRFVSPAIGRLLGSDATRWEGRDVRDLCHPADVAALSSALSGDHGKAGVDVRFAKADGAFRWFSVAVADVRGVSDVGDILLTCREIDDRKALEEALSFQATHDTLTGLMNRTELAARLAEHIGPNGPSMPLSVLYLDLDRFKPVNDTMGHEAGDAVLRAVAQRITDTVPSDACVCRIGGDEFAVLLPGVDEPGAADMAEQLLTALSSPIAVMGKLASIGCSIGVAVAAPDDSLRHPDDLVRRADHAMYAAKAEGRLTYRIINGATPIDEPLPGPAAAPAAPPATVVAGLAGAIGHRPHGPAGAPAAPARSRWSVAWPLCAAGAVVIAIASAGYAQSRAQLRQAEVQRLQEQTVVAIESAKYYGQLASVDDLAEIAASLPWTFDGGAVDRTIVEAWRGNEQLGDGAMAALVTKDGATLAVSPAGAPLRQETAGLPWSRALGGTVALEPLVSENSDSYAHFLVPIRREGDVRAVLVLATSHTRGPAMQMLRNAGIAGLDRTGWSTLDAEGRIVASWNPELLGTKVADRSFLEGLTYGTASPITTSDGTVVIATPSVDRTQQGLYLTFISPSDEIFGDLRAGQMPRDLTLLGVVLAAVAGLAMVSHRRELAVRRSETRLDTLLQNAHDIVIVTNEDGRFTYVSLAIERLLGYDRADATAETLLERIHPDDRERLSELLTEASPVQVTTVRDVRVRDAGDVYRTFDIDALDFRDQMNVKGILLTCHDVTERNALKAEVAHRARHDALTDLPNRAALSVRLEELAKATDTSFAVLFVDLDQFKPVNDTYGHQAGDEVLRTIANRLRTLVRDSDLVCRLGGDEFAVVLDGVTGQEAERTASRILLEARKPIAIGAHTVAVGATIGIALSSPAAEHPEHAVRNADAAMYEAKAAGRDRYAFFGGGPSTP